MKTIIKALVSLYPKSWRNRYENEFDALLNDVSPTWHTLFDVLGGAIKMQWKTGSWWKIVAACAALGVVTSLAISLSLPSHYVSTAVLKAPDENRMLSALVSTEARASLMRIINEQNLYQKLRKEEPIEDVIEGMKRKDILIRPIGHSAYSISYDAPDRDIARRVTARLAELMVNAGGGELLDPANAPVTPVSPQWPVALAIGLIAGLVVGAVVAVFNGLKVWKLAIAMGIAGAAISTAIAFGTPEMYSSTAVLKPDSVDAAAMSALVRNATSDESLNHVIHRFMLDRQRDYFNRLPYGGKPVAHPLEQFRERLRIAPIANGNAFIVTFRDPNRYLAQKVAQEMAGGLVEEASRAGGHLQLELLDPASLPLQPLFPNRPMIISAGLLLGLLSAVLLGLRRRWSGRELPVT